MKRLLASILALVLPITAYADNITVTQGTGKTVAFDDISGVNYQRIKLIFGADGANSGDVASANPLPIQLRTSSGSEVGTSSNPIQCTLANTGPNANAVKVDGSAVTQPVSDGGSSLTVDGTVNAVQSGTWNITNVSGTVSLPTGAATAANQTTANAYLDDLVNYVAGLSALEDTVTSTGTSWTFGVRAFGNDGTGGRGISVNTSGFVKVTDGGTAILVNDDPSLSYLSIDLDETEEQIKASSAELRGYYYKNRSSSELYIKLYDDTADNVDVGTDTPKLVFPIPAGAAANVEVPNVAFGTALTAACTTGILHTDTGAPGANECIVNIYYK